MTHTYFISGMTCTSCEAKVKSALLSVDHITAAEVSKERNEAVITMDQHVRLSELQEALDPKYHITAMGHNELTEQTRSWFQTYKPILLISLYLLGIASLIQLTNGRFDPMQWMQHFMAGFFLVFSFFKLLNLKGFAESYVMYDIVAKYIPVWAYIYAFVELGLGIAYVLNFNPFLINCITLVVMSVSIIGVLQTVLNKKKIQCACLGAVFNLPMSTVTIIEDGLMIAMSAWMLVLL